MLPTALTIASSDSGGGAGIQADLLTFAANGVYGTTAIAALTAQSPSSVTDCAPQTPAMLKAQISQVLAYFPVGALKTGMLFNSELIAATIEALDAANYNNPVVVDPVMVASSGACLLQPDAVAAVKELLLPRATLLTPNLDEAAVLLGRTITTVAEMETAAHALAAAFGTAVLLKGGHLAGDHLVDLLVDAQGRELLRLTSNRIEQVDTHGSGCTLSAAIAARLAKGDTLTEAVSHSHRYLQACLHNSLTVSGRRFINHFPSATS